MTTLTTIFEDVSKDVRINRRRLRVTAITVMSLDYVYSLHFFGERKLKEGADPHRISQAVRESLEILLTPRGSEKAEKTARTKGER